LRRDGGKNSGFRRLLLATELSRLIGMSANDGWRLANAANPSAFPAKRLESTVAIAACYNM